MLYSYSYPYTSNEYLDTLIHLSFILITLRIHAGGYITDRKSDPLIRQKVRKSFANGYYNGIVIGMYSSVVVYIVRIKQILWYACIVYRIC